MIDVITTDVSNGIRWRPIKFPIHDADITCRSQLFTSIEFGRVQGNRGIFNTTDTTRTLTYLIGLYTLRFSLSNRLHRATFMDYIWSNIQEYRWALGKPQFTFTVPIAGNPERGVNAPHVAGYAYFRTAGHSPLRLSWANLWDKSTYYSDPDIETGRKVWKAQLVGGGFGGALSTVYTYGSMWKPTSDVPNRVDSLVELSRFVRFASLRMGAGVGATYNINNDILPPFPISTSNPSQAFDSQDRQGFYSNPVKFYFRLDGEVFSDTLQPRVDWMSSRHDTSTGRSAAIRQIDIVGLRGVQKQPGKFGGHQIGRLVSSRNTRAFFSIITAIDDPGVGSVAWLNPGYVVGGEDGFRATASLTVADPISHYLKVTFSSLSIPTGAVISGIAFGIKKSVGSGRITDYRINVVKGGVIMAANRASDSDWPQSEAFVSSGSSSDLWGETWSSSDFNSGSFGVAISATTTSASALARIDYVFATVYFRDVTNALQVERYHTGNLIYWTGFLGGRRRHAFAFIHGRSPAVTGLLFGDGGFYAPTAPDEPIELHEVIIQSAEKPSLEAERDLPFHTGAFSPNIGMGHTAILKLKWGNPDAEVVLPTESGYCGCVLDFTPPLLGVSSNATLFDDDTSFPTVDYWSSRQWGPFSSISSIYPQRVFEAPDIRAGCLFAKEKIEEGLPPAVLTTRFEADMFIPVAGLRQMGHQYPMWIRRHDSSFPGYFSHPFSNFGVFTFYEQSTGMLRTDSPGWSLHNWIASLAGYSSTAYGSQRGNNLPIGSTEEMYSNGQHVIGVSGVSSYTMGHYGNNVGVQIAPYIVARAIDSDTVEIMPRTMPLFPPGSAWQKNERPPKWVNMTASIHKLRLLYCDEDPRREPTGRDTPDPLRFDDSLSATLDTTDKSSSDDLPRHDAASSVLGRDFAVSPYITKTQMAIEKMIDDGDLGLHIQNMPDYIDAKYTATNAAVDEAIRNLSDDLNQFPPKTRGVPFSLGVLDKGTQYGQVGPFTNNLTSKRINSMGWETDADGANLAERLFKVDSATAPEPPYKRHLVADIQFDELVAPVTPVIRCFGIEFGSCPYVPWRNEYVYVPTVNAEVPDFGRFRYVAGNYGDTVDASSILNGGIFTPGVNKLGVSFRPECGNSFLPTKGPGFQSVITSTVNTHNQQLIVVSSPVDLGDYVTVRCVVFEFRLIGNTMDPATAPAVFVSNMHGVFNASGTLIIHDISRLTNSSAAPSFSVRRIVKPFVLPKSTPRGTSGVESNEFVYYLQNITPDDLAFDATANANTGSTPSRTVTFPHTCSGSNRLLTVLVSISAGHSGQQGPFSPGTLVSDNSVGTVAWSNPSNASASDNSRATAALSGLNVSEYLKVTNFGFAIPSGATIDSIVVSVERSTQASSSDAPADNRVRIVKGGSIRSTDKSSATIWPDTFDAVETYSYTPAQWGETLGSSDINSSGFGFAISVKSSSADTFRIDFVSIAVNYTASTTTVSGITYNGIALRSGGAVSNGTDCRVEAWYLAAPASGTHNVVVAFTGPTNAVVGSTSWTGADQSYPIGNAITATGSGSSASLDVESRSDEFVQDVVCSAINPLVGLGQTELWNSFSVVSNRGAGSVEVGSVSTNMSWTFLLGVDPWAMLAIRIKPLRSLSLRWDGRTSAGWKHDTFAGGPFQGPLKGFSKPTQFFGTGCTGSAVLFVPGQFTSETISTSGSWICPDDVTSVEVECTGGGGGGSDDADGGGGGGGGAYARTVSIPVVPGTSYAIVVGGGGAPGSNGGDSSFVGSSIIQATGGSAASGRTGGAGGVGGSGDTTLDGGNGGSSSTDSPQTFRAGGGGGGGAAFESNEGTDGEDSSREAGGRGGTAGGGGGGYGGDFARDATDGIQGGGGGGAGEIYFITGLPRPAGRGGAGVVVLKYAKSSDDPLPNYLDDNGTFEVLQNYYGPSLTGLATIDDVDAPWS